LSNGLQVLTAYTWGHSIDTASAGSLFGNQGNAFIPSVINQNRGPSDFDIRNAVSAGLTYDFPAPKINRVARIILGSWSTDNFITAHSSSPVNVFDANFFAGLKGYTGSVRPDTVAGQPIYLYGANCASALQVLGELSANQGCPGGKALNPAAFAPPPTDLNGNPLRQGDLGRNALRGFGATQWDFAVHRDFPIRESLKLQFRAEMFNVLNHPNFAPPISDTSNTTQFGLSTQMLGHSLAGGNLGNGAFNPLYQTGGPRSVQFALKVQF
jgi:hypothetical protein